MTNYKLLLITSFLTAVLLGIFSPLWTVKLLAIGGAERLGLNIGIMLLAHAAASFLGGRWLKAEWKWYAGVLAFLGLSILAFAYVETQGMLFIVQMINGLAVGSYILMETMMFVKYSKTTLVQVSLGNYRAWITVATAIALIGGSFAFTQAIIPAIAGSLIIISSLVSYIKRSPLIK